MNNNSKSVHEAIEIFRSGDSRKFHIARGKLKNAEFGAEIGIELLSLAAEIPEDDDAVTRPHADIVRAAAKLNLPVYFEIIRRDRLKYGPDAWEGIVSLLASNGSEAAVATLVDVLSNSIGQTRFRFTLHVEDLFGTNEEFRQIPFLDWLIAHQESDVESALSLRRILSQQLERGWLTAATRHQLGGYLLSRLDMLLPIVRQSQKSTVGSWMYDSEYLSVRQEVQESFHLLGRLPECQCDEHCRVATELVDPHLMLAGLETLYRHGHNWEPELVKRIASCPETRVPMLDAIGQHMFSKIVPAKFRTQLAFAEADMVRWLAFPTELGAIPDEIVFLRKEPASTDPSQEIYFFRFRTFDPHWAAENGWMVGWSGPFPPSGSPETHGSETFSELAVWDGKEELRTAPSVLKRLQHWFKK